MLHITRSHALVFLEAAKTRGENPRELLVLVFDESIPQLEQLARNLSAAMFVDRTTEELKLAPFAIAMPRARAMAFVESQRLLPPVDDWRGESERRTLNAELDRNVEDAVPWIRIEGWPARLRIDRVDVSPPPPKPAPQPQWLVTDAPENSVIGDIRGQIIGHHRIDEVRRMCPTATLKEMRPYEVRSRKSSSWHVEWMVMHPRWATPEAFVVPMLREMPGGQLIEMTREERDAWLEEKIANTPGGGNVFRIAVGHDGASVQSDIRDGQKLRAEWREHERKLAEPPPDPRRAVAAPIPTDDGPQAA